ncbi:MAG: amino acid ABC transporter permease [Desulfobacterales bacterium]|nr:amino acid ABC transporter permease [Desulfobacterales bacterium]MDD4072590.1 amino acid ABC transporter permease [Desulfobacterales bacterium]MDD4391986.1 amino acid ABC transporter permease [Desulfobacterales bacterium]
MDVAFYTNQLIPALNRGLGMSLMLIIPSATGGLFFGIIIGTLRSIGHPLVRKLTNSYAILFRGTPLVVQLFVLYFGLPNLGIYLSPYAAAVIGFMLCSSAYHSEYIRGGLLSIKKGQLLAAQALGFSTVKTMVYIVIPQAIRKALPGCGNEIIYLIKYSSLAYIITCIELTGEGKIIATKYFRFTEVFLVIGLYYLILVTLTTFGLKKLEKKLYIPGFGHHH